jgi:hypothetical protein
MHDMRHKVTQEDSPPGKGGWVQGTLTARHRKPQGGRSQLIISPKEESPILLTEWISGENVA